MQDYVDLYLRSNIHNLDQTAFLLLGFLFLGRILPIISLAPFFGSRILPQPVKVSFALSLFAIFFPQLLQVTHTPLEFDLTMVLLLFKELLIGLLMGFMISIPFIIVQSTGIIIDHQRGGSSLMVNDPSIQNQSSPLGTVFNLLLINLFFMIDGPFQVLDAISQSYDVIPPDKFLSASFFASDSQFWIDIMHIMGRIMILATQLGAPALIIILMTDVFLGIANRLAPQVQITFLGMPLKSLLALAIIFFGWQLFISQIVQETFTWIRYLFTLPNLLDPTQPPIHPV